jgi:hypothetical protein
MRLARILLALLAFLALPGAVQAQTTEGPSLEGTFVYDASASDKVEGAINAAITSMNFALRPIARGRLKRTNRPYQKVVIRYTPAQVSITMDGRAPIHTPANGTPVDWTRPEDGEKLKVSTEWENGRIEQTFQAEDGKRVNTYSISPDGRVMSILVTITSPRLPKPLTYTLRYRRAS